MVGNAFRNLAAKSTFSVGVVGASAQPQAVTARISFRSRLMNQERAVIDRAYRMQDASIEEGTC
jgi:hypothetical protein